MLLRTLPQLAAIVLSNLTLLQALTPNGQPDGEGSTHYDGILVADIPTEGSPGSQKASPQAQLVQDRTGWIATADSFQPTNEAQNVLDGNANTIWHTEFQPTNAAMPHQITIDMQTPRYVNGLTYQPRQDGGQNGNIGQHKIYLSNDGVNWGDPVAIGTYKNDAKTKTTVFASTNARYVKLTVQTEVNGHPWTSAAEINILSASGPEPNPAGVGSWGPTIDTPLVAVSMALLHGTMKVLLWSAYSASAYGGGNGGMTLTASYDPAAQTVTQRTVTNTNHDMFCIGLSLDWKGRVFATGGNANKRASLYDPVIDSWKSAPDMLIGRGYQAQCTISDGRTFVIGGSWAGGQGGKNGGLYSPNANAWYPLPGCPVAPMLTADNGGVFRADNHGWLFGWKDKTVFQAGPSKNMNWYSTVGQGSQAGAGLRGDDTDAMNGNAIMYDAIAGKILTVGGSPNYQGGTATSNAHIITLGNSFTTPTVEKINNMKYPRAFHNSVVLPNGMVFITGGQVTPQPFSDATAQFISEIWDPVTSTFVATAPQPIPRTYHSTALLLPDATVLTGGGGLCGDNCLTNHYDAQIFFPPYLYSLDGSRAPRPVITNSPTIARLGAVIQITTGDPTTTGAGPVVAFSIVRFSSNTHSVNTDQRRVPLIPTANVGTTYTVTIPGNAGQVMPGYWMLFALNANGTPSVAQQIQITTWGASVF